MKKIFQLTLATATALIILSSCQEESDLVLDRVTSPVLLVTDPISESEIQATFYELDKSRILDHTVGIDSIPIPNLSIEVFSGSTSVGTFSTDNSGAIVVEDAGGLIYVGEFKGTKFRFQ